ncbi:MAG: glutathione S-transferase N-terminal domain-containing protein [Gemmatimonadaceae bacterium]|nr:glutathione S-transferase N-terminal domain-containing protein [Acetobacteraceae bacterium]
MKLFHSPSSPYVRKVLVVAMLCDLREGIELLPYAGSPVKQDANTVQHNPLGKVPTLVTNDGLALYDSRVICEFLDARAGGRLFGTGAHRWPILVRQALADGILDAALLARYEGFLRPAELRWDAWTDGAMQKVAGALDTLEAQATELAASPDIGSIAVGCALGYLDFRFAHLPWRDGHPALAKWFADFDTTPAMVATRPPG